MRYEAFKIRALGYEKRWAEGLAAMDAFIERAPPARRIFAELRVEFLLELSRFDEALASVAMQVEGEPGDPDLHVLEGRAYAGLGKTREARASFERALALWSQAEPNFQPKHELEARLAELPPDRE